MAENEASTVNGNIVQALVNLLNSLPKGYQNAILGHFREKPVQTPRLSELLPTQKPAPLRGELVDFCKRIEFCYKEWPGHLMQKPFMPFQATEAFVQEIVTQHGLDVLQSYVEYLEKRFMQPGSWPSFSRPERMKAHYLAWNEERKSQTRPDQ